MSNMSDPRRIVICCDGTWQSSVTWRENIPSNVTKLCRVIARDGTDPTDRNKVWQQIVYYDSGIGTGSLSWWEKVRQGGVGDGLTENVIEAYNFIVNNYKAGDEIFCFGFSRGAYTARAVAGLVSDFGVIKPQHMQLFPELYRAYKSPNCGDPLVNGQRTTFKMQDCQVWQSFVNQNMVQTNGNSEDSRLEVPNSNKVKIVGVWDTVGSLGVPDLKWKNNSNFREKYAFHNVKLSTNIEHAFHALALDERRKAFGPTLWYIPHKDIKEIKDEHKLPELKQVWFPGVHINIGGGSDDGLNSMKGDLEAMANISFAWMLQCISSYLTIDVQAYEKYMDYYFNWTKKIKYECTHHTTTVTEKAWSWVPYIPVINPGEDELKAPKQDKKHEHLDLERGWGLGPFVDSCNGLLYGYVGGVSRTPGECTIEKVQDDGKLKTTPITDLGVTHEYIHPVANYRQVWRENIKEPSTAPPKQLENFRRELSKGRYWWTKKTDGKVSLPEWMILGNGGYNFEREYYKRALAARLEDKDKELKKEGKSWSESDFLGKLDDDVNFKLVTEHKGCAFHYP
ncbi:hypothetical protein GQ43DRAFT_479521 [Delitschia confertaspora ATCC 74209]|uniref:T6SS Phospholipase effector Tle1-like catalytic domain-containing protein n=1 Tax=Delitschia confertaspora ATCC 74209 TaxID=1513339 RepID=A0A9P4JTB0_9PLEO|nr:hypothetical protein GQ43DRAFT_479521 [Delitschia confertaspora ATCC 74209]